MNHISGPEAPWGGQLIKYLKEQLINYSGILVPFTAEEKQLLLESKTIITRSHVLEALYQSYIFDSPGEKSDQLH